MSKKHDVELAKILTRGSVAKYAIICGTILIGLVIVCVTAYKMTTKPAWLVVVLAVLTALSTPSAACGIMHWLRKRYINKHHRTKVELEERVHPNRKSSNP